MGVKRVWIIEKGNSRWKIGEFNDGVLVNVTTTDVGVELTDLNLPKSASNSIDILCHLRCDKSFAIWQTAVDRFALFSNQKID